MTSLPPPPGPPTGQPDQPQPTAAGEPAAGIAAALAELDGLDRLPTAQHVGAFDRVHAVLTESLSAIDGA